MRQALSIVSGLKLSRLDIQDEDEVIRFAGVRPLLRIVSPEKRKR